MIKHIRNVTYVTLIRYIILTIMLSCCIVWAGDVPRFPVKDVTVSENIKDLYINKENKNFIVVTSTPTVYTLTTNTKVVMVSGGAYRVYYNVNGIIKYVEMK
jgi:hypothetical protein